MACSGGDVSGGLFVLVIAGAAFSRTRLALIGGNFGADNSAPHMKSSRRIRHSPECNIRGECLDHAGHNCFPGFSDSRLATPSQYAPSAAASGGGALGHDCVGVCVVGLEARRRRTTDARGKARTLGKLVSFSANVGRGWW